MYNELIIKTNSNEYKVFLQDGFYSSAPPSQMLHKHKYAEVHIVANGGALFKVDNSTFSLKSGNLLIIPGGVFHYCDTKDETTLHAAFQIDYKPRCTSIHNAEENTVLSFINEVENTKRTHDYSKVASFIAFLCNSFQDNQKLQPVPITDYGFLIHEFFTLHYSEKIQLSDLADFLHLSERQTERLVIKHTGNTFRKELSAIRINVAKNLLSSSQMSLTQICRYVGYESYAGFWKALKRHEL